MLDVAALAGEEREKKKIKEKAIGKKLLFTNIEKKFFLFILFC